MACPFLACVIISPITLILVGKLQVQSFCAALKALSRKEVHYGAYATSEQVLLISLFS
jgi:hypothetical protein